MKRNHHVGSVFVFHVRINGHSGSAEILLNSSFGSSLVNARDAKGRSVYACSNENVT